MGCQSAKEIRKDDFKINSEFQEIGLERVDNFFKDAHILLSNAEELRSGIEDSREHGAELAHTWQLKDPRYIDTVQVLFWAASAENGGQIKKTGLVVTTEPPFVKMDASKVTHDTYTLYETLATYLRTIMEGPEKLKTIVEKLSDLSEKVPDLTDEGKREIQESNLDLKGKAQAIARLGKNASKLPKEIRKCKNLQEVLETAKSDLKELIPKFDNLAKTADDVGAKASSDHLIRPGEIFDKFHGGVRKSVKDIEEERQAIINAKI